MRITIQNQPRQIVCETLSQKKLTQKRAGGMAQGVGPEFKPQYCKKKNLKILTTSTYLTLHHSFEH
jgi:hypothetical protein